MKAPIPSATYRFQFHKGFTFDDARALVPYLDKLGISHVYASPFFRAAPGSTHGYDVCDHNELNPEVGSRAQFDAFVAELHRHGMGLIVDFVPNHMGIGEPQNRWWLDVLENGPSSPFARFFDIDWQPVKRELENKVLLPVLGDQYGRVLERGEFRVAFADGVFSLDYHGLRLPLAPRSTRPLLQSALDQFTDPPAELASIITALDYLPGRTDTTPGKVAERMREKKIIRDRLARLCGEMPEVRTAIEAVIAALHDFSNPENLDRLDTLLSDQPYRLSSWKVAAEEINYRRFFDVNSLAAIRMELPEVFEHTHRLLLELIGCGAVNGVRIDHIDGLANPRAYLANLQEAAADALKAPTGSQPLYLLVEKILGSGERLRPEWPIHGTTGYEFGNQATGVLVDPDAERPLTDSYARFIGFKMDFREVVYRGKRLVMQVSMASEVNVLGHLLNRLSESNRWYRDFTINALTTAVREVIACFPVYRSYLVPGQPADEADSRLINRALAQARRRNPALERTVFEFLRDVLRPPENNPHPVDESLRAEFVLKFQQCTGPITAKGVEDTAFYVYQRLAALNEVGGDPGLFGTSVAAFHRENAERRAEFPHCLLATSTHDTKRSEDVRARMAAISEVPTEWAHIVRQWRTANRKLKRQVEGESAPDANEEYLLYQTLLGSWPLHPLDDEGRAAYVARIQDYMVKALHEAKVNSSWIEPNEAWDSAVRDFVERILRPGPTNRFLPALEPFAERIAEGGAINALAQTVLRCTAPGVPDTYQGAEMWDLSLVDPDNRRPVDYDHRRAQIASLAGDVSPSDLVEHWRDGRIKLFVLRTLLRFRRDHRQLFAEGSYTPVQAGGTFAECAVAFERKFGDETLLVMVPRLSSRVGFPATGALWQDTILAPATADGAWTDLFTGRTHAAAPALRLDEVLADFPVAALVRRSQG
jgi:(1->4)-alpha-D-glucan 1-alpha-D-glucosylmutase